MKKLKFATLIGMSCLIGGLLCTPAQSNPATVRLTTEPALDKLRPYEAEATTPQVPVRLKLQAIDPQGQPLKAAKIAVKVLTPPSNPWFTTDFPIIEGKQLLELSAPAADGVIQFEQMLPIRGNYQVLVDVTPADRVIAPYQQTITLPITENWIKYQNFAILAAVLVATGATGGWIVGSRQATQPGEIAPARVRLLLSGLTIAAIVSLLYVNISAEIAQSGMSESMSHADDAMAGMHHGAAAAHHAAASTVTQGSIKVALSGDRDSAVGQVAQLKLQVTDVNTKQPIIGAVKIAAIATEGDWTSFSHTGTTDQNGELNWRSGFFDGVPHRVDVTVLPAIDSSSKFDPIEVSQIVDVEGVAPPLTTRLIVLGYLTGIVAIAFLAAFFLRRKRLESAG